MSATRRWPWILGSAVALAALLVPGAARSSDPPHWLSPSGVNDINCSNRCHTLHAAPGGQLTAAAGNVNLCQSCHNASGLGKDLPINFADRSVQDSRGTSHGFDVAAVHSGYQTTAPTNQAMSLRVMNGQVVCSTCHNQHSADATLGGTPRIDTPAKRTALGSTGTITASGTYTGTTGLWYLVEIVVAGSERPPGSDIRRMPGRAGSQVAARAGPRRRASRPATSLWRSTTA